MPIVILKKIDDKRGKQKDRVVTKKKDEVKSGHKKKGLR